MATDEQAGNSKKRTVYALASQFARRGITADDVGKVVFAKPAQGKPGYNENEVDEFLELVGQKLRDPRMGLTVADVRNVAFSMPPAPGQGYNEDEVDGFLDLVEQQLLGKGRRFFGRRRS